MLSASLHNENMELKMWNYEKFHAYLRRRGNWAVFFLFWFLASAVISAFEHSEQNKRLTKE
jgi:hypothetical protein